MRTILNIIHLSPAMIICVCHRVSDRTIRQCARQGMAFDDLQLELGVATQCGKCESCARAVWQECSHTTPAAHLALNHDTLEGRAWHSSQHLASV
jgi:bacterioferritin-associated ferredoxin